FPRRARGAAHHCREGGMSDFIDDTFGAGGYLARASTGYERRDGQVKLARAVDAAIAGPHHALIEGPTGVGKSVSYLTPAIHHAVTHRKRVLVVTANISLQEQLVQKDLPALRAALPTPFTFALLKGRNNYACKAHAD